MGARIEWHLLKDILDVLDGTSVEVIAKGYGLKPSTVAARLVRVSRGCAERYGVAEDIRSVSDIMKLKPVCGYIFAWKQELDADKAKREARWAERELDSIRPARLRQILYSIDIITLEQLNKAFQEDGQRRLRLICGESDIRNIDSYLSKMAAE